MCECEHVYLNSNEHKRAVIDVETARPARGGDRERFPLHDYRRLAPLMHQLRAIKSELELKLIRKACELTGQGFRRVLKFVRPGWRERQVEAELAHEFIGHGGRFAYLPIIGTGRNACCLHYVSNSDVCRPGELLLLDAAAAYANYNSDLTRTSRSMAGLPGGSGRCTWPSSGPASVHPGPDGRQTAQSLAEGSEEMIEKELVDLGL